MLKPYYARFTFYKQYLEAATRGVSNFTKERLQHRCFIVKFAKFLRTPFLHNTSGAYFWKKCSLWTPVVLDVQIVQNSSMIMFDRVLNTPLKLDLEAATGGVV